MHIYSVYRLIIVDKVGINLNTKIRVPFFLIALSILFFIFIFFFQSPKIISI